MTHVFMPWGLLKGEGGAGRGELPLLHFSSIFTRKKEVVSGRRFPRDNHETGIALTDVF